MQVSEGCIHPYIWAYTWKPKQDRPQKSSFLPYWLETRLLAEPEEPLSARVVGQQAGETHLAWLSRADITTFSAMPGFESGSWRFKLGHWCLENKHYCSLNHLWPQFLMVEITQVQRRWPLFIPPPVGVWVWAGNKQHRSWFHPSTLGPKHQTRVSRFACQVPFPTEPSCWFQGGFLGPWKQKTCLVFQPV